MIDATNKSIPVSPAVELNPGAAAAAVPRRILTSEPRSGEDDTAQPQPGTRDDRFISSGSSAANTLYSVADVTREGLSFAPPASRRPTLDGAEVSRKLADIPLAMNRKRLEIYKTEK